MNNSDMDKIFDQLEEIREWLVAQEEGSLTDEQSHELARLLDEKPELRKAYVAYTTLTARLEWEHAMSSAPAEAEPSSVSTSDKRTPVNGSRIVTIAAVAVALAACLALIIPWFQDGPPNDSGTEGVSTETSEPVDSGVAVITRVAAARWSTDREFQVGDTLAPGVVRLESGLVQLEFYSGAAVICEGPAELEIIGPNRAVCHYGKMHARVPSHARGFTLDLPEVELVDLGTEFGVSVSRTGEIEVHVFDGRVELYRADSDRDQKSRREILAGSSLSIDARGEYRDTEPEGKMFVTEQRLVVLAEQESQQRLDAWRKQRLKLQQDPRVLVYFDFQRQDPLDRMLVDAQENQEKLSGSIVGCTWASGRWPGKNALEFKRPGDRVRLHIPGQFKSLTFSAWIRVDGLDRPFNSLLLTDQYDLGEAHWQIDRLGRLVLGVKHSDGQNLNYVTPSVIDLKRLGQWVHVATVFDGQASKVRHYIDGVREAEDPILSPTTLSIGDAEIGNWGRPLVVNHKSIRNFNGRIDEMILFQSALAGFEIEELYEIGKPE